MIRYQLRCSRGHGFEGWFRSSDAFDRDVQALDCPVCGDRTIEKAIMAPAVLQRFGTRAAANEAAAAGPGTATAPPAAPAAQTTAPAPAGQTTAVATVPAAPPTPEQVQLARAMTLMRKLREHVEASFEHVGDRFAEEARKIHYAEAEPRGIYGQATAREVASLEEEGIAVAPLPNLPKLDG